MIDLKKIKPTTIISFAAIILLFLLVRQCNKTDEAEEKARVEHQNFLAEKDSVRIVKNKLGEEISVKNVYIANRKDLEKINSDLSNELKKLVGTVLFLQKTTATLDQISKEDPKIIETTIDRYPGGLTDINWKYDTIFSKGNERHIEGITAVKIDTISGSILDAITRLERDYMKFKITTGLTELDNSYQIFVKSDYPGLEFTDIEGAIIDKDRFLQKSNESSFVFGPFLGYGLNYNPGKNSFGSGITLGIGLTYNLNKPIKEWWKNRK